MGFLEKSDVDGLGYGPEDVVGLAIVDGEAEHGTRIGGAVLFVRVGGSVGGR